MRLSILVLVFNFLLINKNISQNRDTICYYYNLIGDADTAEMFAKNVIVNSGDTLIFSNFFFETDTFIVTDSDIYIVKNGDKYLFFNKQMFYEKKKSYDWHVQYKDMVKGSEFFSAYLYEFIPLDYGVDSFTGIPYIKFQMNKYRNKGISKVNQFDFKDLNSFSLDMNYDVLYNPHYGLISIDAINTRAMVQVGLPKKNRPIESWFPK